MTSDATVSDRLPAALPGRPRTTSQPEHEAEPTLAGAETRPEKAVRETTAEASSSANWLTLFILTAAVCGTGWYFQEHWWPQVQVLLRPRAPLEKPPVRATPVGTAHAQQQNLNIYLNGLGTVTPLKTVTVRSRVEGELLNIAFTEGQMVQEGDLLAQIDQRPFELQRDQAIGQLARDEAAMSSAQYTLERYEQLLKEKIIPPQQVQEQRALVQQTEGAIKTDRALIAHAELQITYCRITAPVSGRIGLRMVDLGNIVRANDPNGLAVINQIRPITIVFTISQDEIPRIQKRLHEGREMRVEAYDREMTTQLAVGKLIATDNQVDSATGTLRLKAIVENDADDLFPNQFVNTRLLVNELHDVLTVPTAAVQRGPEGPFVYVVGQNQSVDVRMVKLGPSEGANTAIESGLTVGEVVVTEGLDKLQPGAKVTVRTPNSETSAATGHRETAGEPGLPAKTEAK